MSGGHWNHQSYRIEGYGDKVQDALTVLARIEHTLDWGYSSDTCAGCAELEALKLLCDYFDELAGAARGYTWGDRSTTCERHTE